MGSNGPAPLTFAINTSITPSSSAGGPGSSGAGTTGTSTMDTTTTGGGGSTDATTLHGSPMSFYPNFLPGEGGLSFDDVLNGGGGGGGTGFGEGDDSRADSEISAGAGATAGGQKRSSMPNLGSGPGAQSALSDGEGHQADDKAKKRAMTMGSNLSGDGAGEDRKDAPQAKRRKSKPQASGTYQNGVQMLITCEGCRKGKRRCEPSPLVPPDHPDAATLPCARCRRFAYECVRIPVSKKKGPPRVDRSALSDATHGFNPPVMDHHSSSFDGTTSVSGLEGYGNVNGGTDAHRRSSNEQQPYATYFQSSAQGSSGSTSLSPAIPILAVSPSLSNWAAPENLDQVVSADVIDNIIGLFFDYVYPLTPCLHKPTFVANLASRADKTDPVFFALTLVVLASTLVQVPRSLVNFDKREIENLARRCVRVARAKMAYLWEDSVPVQSTFTYLEGIVHLILGNNTAHVICCAQANQLALALRLNEESSYENLDPIESEMRRRIYWLLFQADKSAACMRARTMALRLEDAATLRLPAEVDDEQITAAGILPQPPGRTALITGFNIVTNLFRILNDALLLQRRKLPPSVDSILADLQNVNQLREKVMRTALDVASPLQLRKAYDSRLNSPAQDWESKLHNRFMDFFMSAGDNTHALNSFLVMQGNILVTQHVIRLVLLQTKESLLQQLAMVTQMSVEGIGSLAGMQASEPAEDIATELLDGLNSLPVECVATNGPSLVQKVRFVAIQLMECSVSASPTTARAQKLLLQFLSVLGVIEDLYTFGRDISAE